MCGINVVINGSNEHIKSMQSATFRRGKYNSIYSHKNILISFDLLPITSEKPTVQPFKFGNYLVWINGFISNYKELAKQYNWDLKTGSDTEFLSMFINEFNCKKLDLLNGFFSVFYIDLRNDSHGFFTDRYGIKQLYVFKEQNKTFISSELKGILALKYDFEIDKNSVSDWRYSLGIMNKNTIYKDIKRAEKLPFVIPEKIEIDYETAKNKLLELWIKSVKRNKISHLKDGVFLSGGIDSGIIAKYLNPNYSFSMDYIDTDLSEIENIKTNSTGIHLTMICNDHLIKEYKNKCMSAFDDFKAGSSYTNFALNELASKFCTVIYSGAGGDEFFGGYPHRNNKTIEKVIKRTNNKPIKYSKITHFEYNLLFLDAVLVIEDRMCGFHTMETRYPLLDNDFVDFALSLPDEYLENKRILKDISGLNEKILNSQKKGFSNPTKNDEWVDFCLKNKL